MKKPILLAIALLVAWGALLAEEAAQINKILIFGHHRTSDALIRRTLGLHEGERYNAIAAEQGRRELVNLGIFAAVDVETKTALSGIDVLVIVKEVNQHTLDLTGDFWNETYNSYTGIRVGEKNPLGINDEYWLEADIGWLDKIELGLRCNYLADLNFSATFAYLDYTNVFYPFTESRWQSTLSLSRDRHGLLTRLWGKRENIALSGDGQSGAQTTLNKLGVDLGFETVDSRAFPLHGLAAKATYYKTWDGNFNALYSRFSGEVAAYCLINPLGVIALNAKATLSDGTVPHDEELYFGGINTLRGVPVGTYAGSQALLLSAEWRLPLKWALGSGDDRQKRPVLSAFVFADGGMLAFDRHALNISQLQWDYGIGAHCTVMEDNILRLELCVSPSVRLLVGTAWKF